jgi:alpha-ribazole phosphatase
MQVYLIRHPEPLNGVGRCYGRLDLEVDAQVLALAAAAIRAELPPAVLESATLFTSPLSRCRKLARALASPRAPVIAHELLEMDFGTWQGSEWDRIPRAELDAWALDVWAYRPGGGESATMVAQRWTRWCAQIGGEGVETAIAITHAGLIRVALAGAGRTSAEEFARGHVPFGSLHRIDLETAPARAAS